MLAISQRFSIKPSRATPWGRHVNEGVPEWPPSPWRLLRSLVATWKRKLDGEAGFEIAAVKELLTQLASPPEFCLPPATTAHSRHYMPWDKGWKPDQPEKAKTKVFDAFVAVDRCAEVTVRWPDKSLNAEQARLLDMLLKHLGFLGRSESWTVARRLSDCEAVACVPNCMPLNGGTSGRDQEPMRVLCGDAQTMFENQNTPKHSVRVVNKNDQQTVESPLYDPDWHLCLETLELHSKKWSDPPGSRWVTYLRRADCYEVKPVRQRVYALPIITVARFALDGAVLPLVTETLPLADKVRVTLMGIFKRLKLRERYGRDIPERPYFTPRSRVFSGKDSRGEPLQGHQHTYYLPTDEDGDGRLDHVTLVAEMRFGVDDPLEIKALDQFRRLQFGDGDPLNTLLVGLGRVADFRAMALNSSAVWQSATPFVVTRHAKKRGQRRDPMELLGQANEKAFVAQVLSEELSRLRERRMREGREFAESWRIEALCDEQGVFRIPCGGHASGSQEALRMRPIQFKRFRRKRNDDGGRRPAGAFRISFFDGNGRPKETSGPICLGHSSHFGLGLFTPCPDE